MRYAVVMLLLAGCGVRSTIISHGPETYLISVDDGMGTAALDRLRLELPLRPTLK